MTSAAHKQRPIEILEDYAALIQLMRSHVSQHFSATHTRAIELCDALEIAWTASKLLAMELRDNNANDRYADVA